MITVYLTPYTDHDTQKRHITEHSIGRQLLSLGLSDLYGITMPAAVLDIHIAKGAHGKPFLPDFPNVHFNISHCKDLVVCAFSDAPVGIDAESIRSFRENTLRKVLTPSEQEFMHNPPLSSWEQQELFFRFWTLKESRIKQSGTGMAVSLTDFSFEPDITSDFHQPKSSLPELSFWQWKLNGSHILSLCTSDRCSTPVIKSLQSDTFSWS